MSIFEKIKNLLTDKISDEEIAAHEWVLCPKCQVNITKEDLDCNNWICPNCSAAITKENVEP